MKLRPVANRVRSTFTLLAVLIATQINSGCLSQPGATVLEAEFDGDRAVRTHNVELTKEEFESLEARQAILTKAGEAFLRASGNWDETSSSIDENGEKAEHIPILRQEANAAALDLLSAIKKLNDATIGYLWEGRSGALMYCAGNPSGAIRIVRNGDYLELVGSDEIGNLNFIGVVKGTGEYIRIDRFRSKGLSFDDAPFFWNSYQKDGSAIELTKGSPVLSASKSPPERPNNALGWLFPTRDGRFVVAENEIAPIENVIWVVENGESLEFVHSGPDYTGLYARVLPNNVIKFFIPFDEFSHEDWSDATWKIFDDKQRPRFDPSALAGDVLPARLEVPLAKWIAEDGWVAVEGTETVD